MHSTTEYRPLSVAFIGDCRLRDARAPAVPFREAPLMETAAEFRVKAERCRRLARSVSDRNDPFVLRLLELATEYDTRALELEQDKSDTDPD
jgi:hypothetical protein